MLHGKMHKYLTLLQRLERVQDSHSYLLIQISGQKCVFEFGRVKVRNLLLFSQPTFCGQAIDFMKLLYIPRSLVGGPTSI